jgi:hypothetical protein
MGQGRLSPFSGMSGGRVFTHFSGMSGGRVFTHFSGMSGGRVFTHFSDMSGGLNQGISLKYEFGNYLLLYGDMGSLG